MIAEVTGIRTIRMLYLQLLYRCNFACRHCFHGERLQHADAFTLAEAVTLMRLMHKEYGTEAVNLLGGEPFVYKDLPEVVRYAKQELGLRVEICTNGYRIERRLTEIAPHLDLLRISLEGNGATNDAIRKFGSYQGALSALDHARDLGIPTGATMTVNARNIDEVLPVTAGLRDDHFGGGLVDTGDGVEQVEGVAKGRHRLLDASAELVDHRGELVVLIEMQADEEGVVLAEASGQGLGELGDPVAELAFGHVREGLRVAFALDKGFEHGPAGDAHDVGGNRGQLDPGVFQELLQPLDHTASFTGGGGPGPGQVP